MKKLKDRLFHIRRSLGLNQEEMAFRIGKSTPAWQSYERGLSVPGGEVFRALFDLGFDLHWLVSGQGCFQHGQQSKQARATECVTSKNAQQADGDQFDPFEDALIAMEADKFWQLFHSFTHANASQAGWSQVEIVKRMPEFQKWLKKKNDDDGKKL